MFPIRIFRIILFRFVLCRLVSPDLYFPIYIPRIVIFGLYFLIHIFWFAFPICNCRISSFEMYFPICISDSCFSTCIFQIWISGIIFPRLDSSDMYVLNCCFPTCVYRFIFPDIVSMYVLRLVSPELLLPIYTFRPVLFFQFVFADVYWFELSVPFDISQLVFFPIACPSFLNCLFQFVFPEVYFPSCVFRFVLFRFIIFDFLFSELYLFNVHFPIVQHFANYVFCTGTYKNTINKVLHFGRFHEEAPGEGAINKTLPPNVRLSMYLYIWNVLQY